MPEASEMAPPKFAAASRMLQYGYVAVLASLLYVTYVWNLTSGMTTYPGGLTDARFNNVILEHLYLWASGHAEDLWRPDFFYPYPDTITFSDNHFGSGAIYVAARFLGLEREDAYTLWYVIGTAVTFLAAWYAFVKFRLPPAAAGIAAIVFAFAGTMLFRTEHSQLIYRFATPLAALYAWQFLQTARLQHLGLLGIFTAWQFLCSIYLGIFLLLFFAGAFLGILVFGSTREQLFSLWTRLRAKQGVSDWIWLAVGVLLSLVTLYVLARYAWAARYYGFGRPPSVIFAQQPVLGSYLVFDYSPYYARLGRWVQDDFLRHEKQMFIGGVGTILMLFAMLPIGRKAEWKLPARVFAVSLAFLFLVTLKFPGGFTLYWPFAHLPGFSSVRAVGRVIEVMLLPAGFFAGIGFAKLATLPFGRAAPAFAAAVAMLAAAGFYLETSTIRYVVTTPRSVLEARQQSMRDLVPETLSEDAILAYRERPDENQFVKTDIDAMVLAQQLRVPVLNGYSGNFPPGYRPLHTCADLLFPVAGAATYNKMTTAEINDVLDRIVTLDFGDCGTLSVSDGEFAYTYPDDPQTSVPLPAVAPKGLSLSVDRLESVTPEILMDVTLHNEGDFNIPGNFQAAAHHIRFSWRFVPAGTDAPLQSGWDTREQLAKSVAPGEQATVTMSIQPPAEPGRYTVQVSLVQEEVMWFHNNGMSVASAGQTIEVGPDGSVTLSP